MNQSIGEQISSLECRPPASPEAIRAANQALGVELPQPYIDFLLYSNGAQGFTPDSYLDLRPVEKLVELNEVYEVSKYAPGVVLVGSDGGGCGLGFDSTATPPVFVNIPFVVMCREEMLALGPSFGDLLKVFPPDVWRTGPS